MIQLHGRSLWIFENTNCIRVLCARIVSWYYFDNLIVFIIIISTVNLSLDSPLNDPNSTYSNVNNYIDYSITAIFTLEALLKIVVHGFLINGSESYLRVLWNFIDFLTVIISISSYIGNSSGDQGY
jgi:Ion transport protein